MKTKVKTNVETNVGLMFWARWPAGGGPLGQPGGPSQASRSLAPQGLASFLVSTSPGPLGTT